MIRKSNRRVKRGGSEREERKGGEGASKESNRARKGMSERRRVKKR